MESGRVRSGTEEKEEGFEAKMNVCRRSANALTLLTVGPLFVVSRVHPLLHAAIQFSGYCGRTFRVRYLLQWSSWRDMQSDGRCSVLLFQPKDSSTQEHRPQTILTGFLRLTSFLSTLFPVVLAHSQGSWPNPLVR